MNPTQNQPLNNIGLKKREIEVYQALVRRGPSTIAKIAEYTGLHRPIIYRTLDPLQSSGLIAVATSGKRKLYVAEPPERLAALFEQLGKNVSLTIKELQHIYEIQKKKPLLKYLDGREGVRFALTDVVDSQKRGSEYYRYNSYRSSVAAEKYNLHDLRRRRDAKQLRQVTITDGLTEVQKKPSLLLTYKVLPPNSDLYVDNIAEFIYGNKVAFIDYDNETAMIIEDPSVADFQKKLFKILYKLL